MTKISPLGHVALHDFEAYLRTQQDLGEKTVRNYLSDLAHFIAWFEGREQDEASVNFSPELVVVPTLTRYRTYLQTTRNTQTDTLFKPATVNRHLVALKRYFSWLAKEHQIECDPSAVVKTIAVVAPPPRQLTHREEELLLAAAVKYGSLRDSTLLVVLLHTGLRAGEVCALPREDITLKERSGSVKVRMGKGNKYRDVPLNDTARSALRKYLASMPHMQGRDVLFPSEKGKGRLTARAIGFLVKRTAYHAKVEDVSPHDLRHQFGYRMAAKHVPLHVLAKLMGHSSLESTKIYTQPTSEDLQAAVEQIAW